MTKTTAVLFATLSVAALPAVALAADDAMIKTVRDACLAAGSAQFDKVKAIVDANGTASYGLALLRGKGKGTDTAISVICVYDKATKKVEVGTILPEPGKKK